MCRNASRKSNREGPGNPSPGPTRKEVYIISKQKEFLYVGHYVDTKGRYILKIGTTNDLERRAQEHTRNYRKAKQYTMPENAVFKYDWHVPLSKYNTIRFEDVNRELWQHMGIGHFIRNDRFLCDQNPGMVTVTIRKTYFVNLGEA